MDAVARGVEFFHVTPQPATNFLLGYLETRDSLSGNLGHMFDIVEEGHGIVIGP
jgi:hypothetical protein